MKKDKEQKKRKKYTGKVISIKMQGTVIVEVERKVIHPLYKKVLKRSSKYKVDSNFIELQVGDKVNIVETRPISKEKHFKVEKKVL